MLPRAVAVLFALTALCRAGSAHAYCLSAACEGRDDGKACSPAEDDDCDGPLLEWKTGCVGFSVHEDGSSQVSASEVTKAARAAFETWEYADCGDGLTPGFHVEYLGRVQCSETEYNKAAGNANVIMFRDDDWPYPEDTHSVAKTTTTFDPNSGALVDADIEINSASFTLTTSEGTADFDLQSVLTHEAGHFLGIGHSADEGAAMFAVYEAGGNLRVLSPDDVAAVCAAYPPTTSKDVDCNPLPKHGFDPACADQQNHADCAAGGGGPEGTDGAWGACLAALAIALAGGARRRRLDSRPFRARVSWLQGSGFRLQQRDSRPTPEA